MALSIVAQAPAAAESRPGITQSSQWRCDIFRGTAEALIAAGLITQEQLAPQTGRRPGYTVFLPDGSPCPRTQRAWREPGYKTILCVDDGTCIVEVTVSKEMQAWRRKAEKAAEHEREQQRIDAALAESGPQYRNWTLKHGYTGDANWIGSRQTDYEWWEGTKEQLQREGIGVGLLFPGEPGGPKELYCKCPLGFDVHVYLPCSRYAAAKAAARIYTAMSWYVPRVEEPKQYVQHAPGVLREVWTPSSLGGGCGRDYYCGTAAGLVAAGLVPSLDLFPGQPGRNKMQASYQKGWTPCTTSAYRELAAVIRRRGKGEQFSVEVTVSAPEEERRREVCKQLEHELGERAKVLAVERKQLRQGAQPEKTEEEFRAERVEAAEFSLKLLWGAVFAKPDGALSFDLGEGTELVNEVAEAFQTIRNAVQSADILRDNKLMNAARTRLKLVAARKDDGLQSLLRSAQHLRLVRPAPDNEQG